ncbi:MAG: hypothetical protein IJL24_03740 [Treponema sp.]|nr:hypothetical protein [Treponema sp.]
MLLTGVFGGSGNTRTFTMPAQNVTVNATFAIDLATITSDYTIPDGAIVKGELGTNVTTIGWIQITGGNVTAVGNNSAAGIGCGDTNIKGQTYPQKSVCGDITISGGLPITAGRPFFFAASAASRFVGFVQLAALDFMLLFIYNILPHKSEGVALKWAK